MSKKVFALFIVVVFFIIGTSLFSGQMLPEDFEKAKNLISKAELSVDRIEKQKIITESVLDQLEQDLKNYMDKIHSAHSAVNRIPDKKEKFREELKAQKKRLERLEGKMKNIETEMKDASVMLEESFLQKMSSSELEEFKKFLTPAGQSKMEKVYPDIFKKKKISSIIPMYISIGLPIDMKMDAGVANFAAGGDCLSESGYCWSACQSLRRWMRPGCYLGCALLYIGCLIAN
jgi:TolA-binding protein